MCGGEITDFQEAGFSHGYKKMKITFFEVIYIYVEKKVIYI